MKTFIQKKEGVTIDNFYQELLDRTVKSSGLPPKFLGHDPNIYMRYEYFCKYEINNLEDCVCLFEDAVKKKKKIYIYTDYDLDGIGCAVNMKLFCDSLGIKATIYIPDRYKDGYGLTSKFVDRIINECAAENKEALLMTFDNGIAAIDEIAKAKEAGIQVVVMDHHEPKRNENGDIILPNADVICDPHITGGTCIDYCGAGLAYKFAQRCYKDTRLSSEKIEYMLNMMCVQTAISTIADNVPLTLENYQIVEKGLTLLSQGKCTYGMKLLAEEPVKDLHGGFGLLGKNITTSDIAYGLVPALNAWGRLEGNGSRQVAWLLSYNGGYTDKMSALRDAVIEKNEIRKELTEKAMDRVERALTDEMKEKGTFLVVYDPDCILGLCGLIAGNLAAKYHMPCVFLTDDPENPNIIKGSGRSFGDINLKELLDRLQECLYEYGGHPAACGLALEKSKLEEFTRMGNEALERCEVSNAIEYDIQCHVKDVIKVYVAQSKFMWGENNPCPVILVDDIRFDDSRILGKTGSTVKISQKNPVTGDIELDMLHFKGAAIHNEMTTTKTVPDTYNPEQTKTVVDQHPESIIAIGMLSDNVWQNRHTIQLLADYFADAKYVEKGARGEIISSLDTDDIKKYVENVLDKTRSITGNSIDINKLNPIEIKKLYDHFYLEDKEKGIEYEAECFEDIER